MKNNARIVERYQAEKLLRFINFVIDYIFTYLLVILFYALLMLVYSIVSGIDYLMVADSVADINPLLDRLVTAFFYALFIYLTEMISKGRSLGKLITGTMVVTDKGGLPTGNDFLKRNFSRIVPFDVLSFLGTNGWHDSWSDTRVVKRKSYLEALERENSIEDIGQIAS